MKFSLLFPSILISLLSVPVTFSSQSHEDFLQCLSTKLFSNSSSDAELIYTLNTPSYFTVLNSTIRNPKNSSPSTPKPLVIVTPRESSHVQATLYCSKEHGLQIRTRSGGHDLEGLSYISNVPFVIIDLRNLRSISVNVDEKSAWVQAGATIGEVYYRVAEKSGTLGFPAGVCHSVGVGGHFSGGGYGALMRKYGLAADNIIDARLVNVDGEILDRESMGEDLFWAIRGGGAASFGVVLEWKIRLVHVPSTVTVFYVERDFEEEETKKAVKRWQYVADKFPEDLLLSVRFTTANSTDKEANKVKIQVAFFSLYLGGADSLLLLLQKSLPELGLAREDCTETSWIESVLYFGGIPAGQRERLLDNSPLDNPLLPFKAKLDYVKEPIPEAAIETMVKMLLEEEVGKGLIQLFPYGGTMSNISESEIPFPHRAGNLYKIIYYVLWDDEEGDVTASAERHLDWIRRVYKHMTPYVSKNPRSAYLNYRDLDLGVNNDKGATSYAQASIWGTKYFHHNFKRLVHVKTEVDPSNFFRNEQSIPPLPTQYRKKKGQ